MADLDSKSEKGTAARIFRSLVGEVALIQNPRDLSQGQKLALAISIQLSKTTNLLMLDEPTLGFDFDAKASLVNHLRRLSESGVEIIVATHDLEFADAIATKTEYLQGGVVNNV
jgi:energy-coupling factor transport system ATP-binding protein